MTVLWPSSLFLVIEPLKVFDKIESDVHCSFIGEKNHNTNCNEMIGNH